MTVPGLTTNKLNNQLAITQGAGGKYLVVIGPSSTGSSLQDTPIAYTRSKDVIDAYGYGPMPEFACYAIENYGLTVVCVKTAATTAGDPGTLTTSGWTGTSVVTVTGTPNDDYEYRLKVVTGFTQGVTGGQLQWSLDGGRTWSATVNLGTAVSYTIPNSGITINFGAGTGVANDVVSGTSTAPACTSSDLTTPLANLTNYKGAWEFAVLASAVDPTIGAVLDAWIVSMLAKGKFHWWLASAAIPTAAQSDSAYQTALGTAFASYSTDSGSVTAGAARTVSSVPSRRFNYVRPVSLSVAPLILSVSEEIRISQDGLVLPGVSLTDSNNNLATRCHDEYLQPGLDDLRFLALRTWPDTEGVYCNRPKMFGASTSDFDMIPKIRTWNLWAAAAWSYFRKRLQKPVLADPKTGFILETFARAIEKEINQILNDLMLSKPKASAQVITLSRKDPLLNVSNPTLTVDGRMQPLGYFDFVTLNMGFAPNLFNFPVTVQTARAA